MSFCARCQEQLPTGDDYVKCGQCNACYHFICCGVSHLIWNKKTKHQREKWRCKNCRESGQTFSSELLQLTENSPSAMVSSSTMSFCARCQEQLSIGDDYVKCGQCNTCYHFICCGVSPLIWNKRSKNEKEKWKCKGCRESRSQTFSYEFLNHLTQTGSAVPPPAMVSSTNTQASGGLVTDKRRFEEHMLAMDRIQATLQLILKEIKALRNDTNASNGVPRNDFFSIPSGSETLIDVKDYTKQEKLVKESKEKSPTSLNKKVNFTGSSDVEKQDIFATVNGINENVKENEQGEENKKEQ